MLCIPVRCLRAYKRSSCLCGRPQGDSWRLSAREELSHLFRVPREELSHLFRVTREELSHLSRVTISYLSWIEQISHIEPLPNIVSAQSEYRVYSRQEAIGPGKRREMIKGWEKLEPKPDHKLNALLIGDAALVVPSEKIYLFRVEKFVDGQIGDALHRFVPSIHIVAQEEIHTEGLRIRGL